MKLLRLKAVEYGESHTKDRAYTAFLNAHAFLDFVESSLKHNISK